MDNGYCSHSEFAGDADTSRRTRLFTQDNQPSATSAYELYSRAFENALDRAGSN